MTEALQIIIEATEEAHKIEKFDRQMLGFDVEVWLTVMRGQTLVMLGRKEEARPFLDRIIQTEDGKIDTLHHIIPSWAYVDLAWVEGNVGLAQEHAERAYHLAIKSGNPYLRVYGQACRGLSHIVAGRLTSGIQDFSEAVSFARSRRAGLEAEPRILADLANAYKLSGEDKVALANADEAIMVASARHARIPECLARIVRAKLLLRSPIEDEVVKGGHELARAKTLMRESGAVLFKRFVEELEADDVNARQTRSDRLARS